MIHDLRAALLAAGAATVLVALAGLALDNHLILNIGLKSAGGVLLTYGAVALIVAVANVVTVVKGMAK